MLPRRQPDNQNRQANRLVNGLVQSSWLHCERETTEIDLAGKLLPVRDARRHSSIRAEDVVFALTGGLWSDQTHQQLLAGFPNARERCVITNRKVYPNSARLNPP